MKNSAPTYKVMEPPGTVFVESNDIGVASSVFYARMALSQSMPQPRTVLLFENGQIASFFQGKDFVSAD